MQFEISDARPRVDSTAVVAPTAALSGDVTLGANVVVSFGAVILGEDGPVVIGPGTVYGIERLPNGMIDMRLVTERAVTAARRGRWTRLDE
jgi:serine acetyltransferase